MIYRGMFIVGIEPCIGKTAIGCGFARTFRESGLKVAVFKPVETGCNNRDGTLFPVDGFALIEASGSNQAIEDVVPYCLEACLPPLEAAKVQGVDLTLNKMFHLMDGMSGHYDFVIIEGAGELMTPLREHFYLIDLIRASDYPCLIVAPVLAGIADKIITCAEKLRERGIGILGVVLNQAVDTDVEKAKLDKELLYNNKEFEVLLELDHFDAFEVDEKITDACRAVRDHVLARTAEEAIVSAMRYLPENKIQT